MSKTFVVVNPWRDSVTCIKLGGDLCVGVLVERKLIKHNYEENYNTYNDMVNIKTLHRNTKGVFYNDKVDSSYRSRVERTYLTLEELEQLNDYVEGYNK